MNSIQFAGGTHFIGGYYQLTEAQRKEIDALPGLKQNIGNTQIVYASDHVPDSDAKISGYVSGLHLQGTLVPYMFTHKKLMQNPKSGWPPMTAEENPYDSLAAREFNEKFNLPLPAGYLTAR